MVNQVASVPYSFTGVMANYFKATATAKPSTGPINIPKVEWLAPAAPGDSFVLKNEFAQIIATFVATADTVARGVYEMNFIPAFRVHDFQVTTLSSGTLYIYTC
jgi:hypothetical protein